MKARLIQVVLNLQVVLDDGDNLTPVEVRPIAVPANQIDAIPASLREALAQFQQQIDAQQNATGG